MPTATKRLYPGAGAKGTILTRFIHPWVVGAVDKKHRTTVTLIDVEEKRVNKRQQECFLFQCFDGPASDMIGHSVKNHIILTQEGNRAAFFYAEDVDAAAQRDEQAAFVEPKIKWRHSKAKYILTKSIIDGLVPERSTDNNGNSTMDLEEIYYMHEEYAKYYYEKFGDRLARVRAHNLLNKNRAAEDQITFDLYKSNHGHFPEQFKSECGQGVLKDMDSSRHRFLKDTT